jgi:hypothetical protein
MRKAREGETDKSGSQSEWSVSCTAARIIHLYTTPRLQCQTVGKASRLPFLALLIPHFIPHAVQRSVRHTHSQEIIQLKVPQIMKNKIVPEEVTIRMI